jgi:hypothetical protein
MVSNTNTFHVYGAVLNLPDGDIALVAGNNITITPAFGSLTIAAQIPASLTSINGIMGAANLEAGPGVTINITGNNIQIGLGDSYVTESGFNVYVTEDGLNNYVVE